MFDIESRGTWGHADRQIDFCKRIDPKSKYVWHCTIATLARTPARLRFERAIATAWSPKATCIALQATVCWGDLIHTTSTATRNRQGLLAC